MKTRPKELIKKPELNKSDSAGQFQTPDKDRKSMVKLYTKAYDWKTQLFLAWTWDIM